jgi:hypothetical protein
MKLTLKEKHDLGRSLIALGRKLRDGFDPEVNEEVLNVLFSLAPNLPKAEEPKVGPKPKVDSLMELILGWVRDGEHIPSGPNNKANQNALIKLRRNGQIFNEGSVRNPKWRLTTTKEQARISKEVRERRKENDLEYAARTRSSRNSHAL